MGGGDKGGGAPGDTVDLYMTVGMPLTNVFNDNHECGGGGVQSRSLIVVGSGQLVSARHCTSIMDA